MIHHLNCGTMCPRGAAALGLVDKHAHGLVARCVLIEDSAGLVLIDTGYGMADVSSPSRIGPARWMLSPRFSVDECAVSQVRALGFDPADVRHVLVTHLDLDHAGGLSDFPNAEVHVHAAELDIVRRMPLQAKARYRPGQWSHGPRWVEHAEAGEPWFGFERVRLIEGLSTEIAMLPLFGHTVGHSGYAIRDGSKWLLHAGDAYLRAGEVATPRVCGPGLSAYHALNSASSKQRRANADRLGELAAAHSDEVTVFCSHDPVEFRRDTTG